ncbi:MAG: hypothetical protein HN509_09605 [Halobacteriovoraceae bacterium]|jgi:hypothetical protein|nr:hypothetical protein [Halobacteriovoraceae bacterium]MBT5095911.1 hypothetical protein [Halobacteriovoraceae bacterium]
MSEKWTLSPVDIKLIEQISRINELDQADFFLTAKSGGGFALRPEYLAAKLFTDLDCTVRRLGIATDRDLGIDHDQVNQSLVFLLDKMLMGDNSFLKGINGPWDLFNRLGQILDENNEAPKERHQLSLFILEEDCDEDCGELHPQALAILLFDCLNRAVVEIQDLTEKQMSVDLSEVLSRYYNFLEEGETFHMIPQTSDRDLKSLEKILFRKLVDFKSDQEVED